MNHAQVVPLANTCRSGKPLWPRTGRPRGCVRQVRLALRRGHESPFGRDPRSARRAHSVGRHALSLTCPRNRVREPSPCASVRQAGRHIVAAVVAAPGTQDDHWAQERPARHAPLRFGPSLHVLHYLQERTRQPNSRMPRRAVDRRRTPWVAVSQSQSSVGCQRVSSYGGERVHHPR